jgi:hypothetical protein
VKSKLVPAKETKKATSKALIQKKNLFRDQSLSCAVFGPEEVGQDPEIR